LTENHRFQNELAAHKADLELPRIRSETVEDDLVQQLG
jgi:hypothetical protein